jgi:hypothetical protein
MAAEAAEVDELLAYRSEPDRDLAFAHIIWAILSSNVTITVTDMTIADNPGDRSARDGQHAAFKELDYIRHAIDDIRSDNSLADITITGMANSERAAVDLRLEELGQPLPADSIFADI